MWQIVAVGGADRIRIQLETHKFKTFDGRWVSQCSLKMMISGPVQKWLMWRFTKPKIQGAIGRNKVVRYQDDMTSDE